MEKKNKIEFVEAYNITGISCNAIISNEPPVPGDVYAIAYTKKYDNDREIIYISSALYGEHLLKANYKVKKVIYIA